MSDINMSEPLWCYELTDNKVMFSKNYEHLQKLKYLHAVIIQDYYWDSRFTIILVLQKKIK